MAKEEKSLGLGEISTIRDILMGQQIAEYQKKFDLMEASNVELDKTLNKRINSIEKDVEARLSTIEKEMTLRFDKLEKLVKENISALENKVNKVTKSDKEMLGKMLQDMGSKLLNGKAK